MGTDLKQAADIIAAPELPAILSAPRARGRLRRFLDQHPMIVLGGMLLAILVVIAIFAPWIAPHDPAKLSPISRLKGPSATHWFGTDALGRDIFSRVAYGARVSLLIGLTVAVVATAGGLLVGLVSGYIRWADGIIMRVIDGLMSIPAILIAIALMALTRGSVQNVIIAITIAEIPRVARLARGTVLSLREQPYVEAAITCGTSTPRIIWRHILPNTLGPMTVQSTYICASAMMTEAVLSFIGAGIPPTVPSWGTIMAEGRTLWQIAFHIIAFPAVFLGLAVLGINMLGDGLRDHFDPRTARKG